MAGRYCRALLIVADNPISGRDPMRSASSFSDVAILPAAPIRRTHPPRRLVQMALST